MLWSQVELYIKYFLNFKMGHVVYMTLRGCTSMKDEKQRPVPKYMLHELC